MHSRNVEVMKQISKNLKIIFYHIVASKYFLPFLPVDANSKNNICIIMMHGIHNQMMAATSNPPKSSISVSAFESNISLLIRHYQIISLDEAVEMMIGRRSWRERCAVLTFDDSLRCLVTIAAPLLVAMGLTATFYVSTESIKTQKPYWWMRLEYAVNHTTKHHAEIKLRHTGQSFSIDGKRPYISLPQLKIALKSIPPQEVENAMQMIEHELDASLLDPTSKNPFADLLTWDDVHRLCELGMTVGSHTITHPNLSLLNSNELHHELRESKNELEAVCRTPVRHLCYPYGYSSAAVRLAAADCGYLSGVTTDQPGWNQRGSDPFRLRRFNMPNEPHKISYILSGKIDIFRSIKRFSNAEVVKVRKNIFE